MRDTARKAIALTADILGHFRGYRFPNYFTGRDRLRVLLFGIEPDLRRFIRRNVRRGMTVLDIGGNVGLICRIFATTVGSQGRVLSFEPDPYTRRFLEHNVQRFRNTTVFPIAISDANKVANLYLHPGSGTANSLLAISEATESVQVQCSTLDKFLEVEATVRPDIIKIDVEGAEPEVFSGMINTIRQFPQIMIITEFCPANLANGRHSPSDFLRQLLNLGLSVEIILKNGHTRPVSNCAELLTILNGDIYCNLVCRSKEARNTLSRI